MVLSSRTSKHFDLTSDKTIFTSEIPDPSNYKTGFDGADEMDFS